MGAAEGGWKLEKDRSGEDDPGIGAVPQNGATPKSGWFLMENRSKMDENRGYPDFRKTRLVFENEEDTH